MKKRINSFKYIIDILLIVLLYILYYSNGDVDRISFLLETENVKSILLIILFWSIIGSFFNIYSDFRFHRFLTYFLKNLYAIVTFIVVFALLIQTFSLGFIIDNLLLFILTLMFIYLSITLFYFYGLKIHRMSGHNVKKVIMIGYNNNSHELISLIDERKEFGLSITKILTVKDTDQEHNLFDFEELTHYLNNHFVDFAYISLGNNMHEEIISMITNILEDKYIPIGFIPSSSLELKQSLEINYLDSFPILTYKKYPLDNSFNQIIKRIFDISFTFVVFALILWWVLPLIALMVYITQGRPILFKQKRNGLNGKEFDCLKFRTMRPHKHNNVKPTERDDPRVTKLGKILRQTSLDELPQFINVLKGEMSIVGPRPHMVSENETYSEIIKRYALRHYVKPGITGLAQVKGYRGAIDSDKDMEMRIRTDIYYVRNWSFLLDLFIIYKTAKLMIFGDENAI